MNTKIAGTLLATAAMLYGGALVAQEPDPPESDCRCVYDIRTPTTFSFNRARLGVRLGEPEDASGRTGVAIADVTEGGPAARAGIRTGDIVVSLDGAGLGENPTARLMELMGDVEPGDTVDVAYVRDGQERTARVVTDRMSAFNVAVGSMPRAFFNADGNAMRYSARADALDPAIMIRSLMRDGLELVEMNDRLGEYFGTGDGVLVAEAPEDSPLGIRPGDVILRIGDREIRDPAHARSILSSYRADEAISFRIVRERREMTVEGRKSAR